MAWWRAVVSAASRWRVGGSSLAVVSVLVAAAAGSAVAQAPGSPSPLPSVSGGLDLCWDPALGRDQEPCGLPAGHYAPSVPTPAMEFDLDAGWLNYRVYPDGFALAAEGAPFDLSVVRGARSGVADAAPDDAAVEELVEVAIGEGMAGVVAYLLDHAALQVVGTPQALTVGGLPATVLDLDAPAGVPGLFNLEQDGYGLTPGDRLRAWVVDHPEGTIAILAEVYAREPGAMASAEDIDALMARLEPFVASITFPGTPTP